jgi:NAD+ synthase
MTETAPRVLPDDLAFDMDAAIQGVCAFLRARLDEARLTHYVLGLSGGVDSACSAGLAVRALGPERLVTVKMPSASSVGASLADAEAVEEALAIPASNRFLIPVAPIVEGWRTATGETPGSVADLRVGNVAARARMLVLWDQAARHQAIVLGTENRTENLLGYFTIYGDAGTAVEPISPFFKSQVWALAGQLGLPEQVIRKAPTADLWAGQTDESELGMRYEDADRVLYWAVDRGNSAADTSARTGLPLEVVSRVLDRWRATQFKRDLPYRYSPS